MKPSIRGFELGVAEATRRDYGGRKGRCSREGPRNGRRRGGGVSEECAGEGRECSAWLEPTVRTERCLGNCPPPLRGALCCEVTDANAKK